ncbi:MAG: hypothetical protein KBA81_01875 [Rhabdochlamydiaceae bacterium]|nr:hypothetical protein [Rhabdochlamydiaceae bacterium]
MTKLKPFSHLPGTFCIIPETSCQVQVFPALLRFTDFSTGKTWDEKLWKGPVEGFTLELDLEKGYVEVFGKTAVGFKRRQIGERFKTDHLEHLSLGKHTKLDWELVLRRLNMEEMVPVLFQLGQLVPESTAQTPILNFLKFSDKTEVAKQLKLFFKTGFHGLMAPRLIDEDFQGIIEEGPEGKAEGSPLALLREGYIALRALFFTEDEGFSLLPNLPPEFHAGRLVNLRSSMGDIISIEWSKKLLKKVYIKPAKTREIPLTIQKSLCSFRINQKIRQEVKKPLSLIEGKTLFLDRFEK